MGAELIAVACGTCSTVRRCHFVPDACFGCGARFYRGAPVALVSFDIGLRASGAGVSVSPTLDAEFVGAWSTERRAEIEQRMLGKREAATGKTERRLGETEK